MVTCSKGLLSKYTLIYFTSFRLLLDINITLHLVRAVISDYESVRFERDWCYLWTWMWEIIVSELAAVGSLVIQSWRFGRNSVQCSLYFVYFNVLHDENII